MIVKVNPLNDAKILSDIFDEKYDKEGLITLLILIILGNNIFIILFNK